MALRMLLYCVAYATLQAKTVAYAPPAPSLVLPYSEARVARPAPVTRATDEEAALCRGDGDFHLGEKVSHISRGPVVIACDFKERDDNLVGVCGPPNSGHDNWNQCRLGHQAYCGKRALWFVPCSELSSSYSSSLRPQESRPGSVVKAESSTRNSLASETCGCAWNAHTGCEISGPQLIQSLTDESVVVDKFCSDDLAGDKAAMVECRIRKEVFAAAQSFSECVGLSAQRCREASHCEWGSQGSGECGIDEEQLMYRLVGPEQRYHPLVQTIMLQDHCKKHSEESCVPDPSCSWTPTSIPGASRCDVSPDLFMKLIIQHPEMVLSMYHGLSASKCSALEEAMCSHSCEWHAGQCVPRALRNSVEPLEDMMTSLCLMAGRQEGHKCPAPCQQFANGRSGCEAPHVFPWRNPSNMVEDVTTNRVVKVMSILGSLTDRHAFRCQMTSPQMCQVAAPTCSEDPADALGGHARSNPGVKGLIKSAAAAIAEGKAASFLDSYLQNNPDKVQEITEKALDGLSSFLTSPARRPPGHARSDEESLHEEMPLAEEVLPETTMEAAVEDELAEAETLVEEVVREAVDDPDEPQKPQAPKKRNLLMKAALFGAAVSACICLCFSVCAMFGVRLGLGQAKAREPLLGGELASPPLREQEMTESVPAMMRPSEA